MSNAFFIMEKTAVSDEDILQSSFYEKDSFYEEIDVDAIGDQIYNEDNKDDFQTSGPSKSSIEKGKAKSKKRIFEGNHFKQPAKRSHKSPKRLGLLEREKHERIQNVLKEIDAIQAELSQSDIGPFYGLPGKVSDLLFRNRKIQKLYDWQHECLERPEVSQGKNLIYSLPTSGGKTLVAEILIMKQMLCKKKNCVFVLPYVSIVQEKVRDLSPFAVDLNFIVEEYASNKGPLPPVKRRKSRCVYIATIEKASSLINSLIELKRLNEIGLLVIDELHMIGDGGARGARLETMLTKVKFMSGSTQIIGMSATLGDVKDLQSFLSAGIYCGDFRPVELKEYIKVNEELLEFRRSNEQELVKSRPISFPYTSEMKNADPDYLTGLLEEIVPENSCLIFCPTKKSCENVANLVCKLLNKSIIKIRYNDKKALYNTLLKEGNGKICSILKFTLPYGVAYHHAGLTADERNLLEEAYTNGTLCCLCCTTTLAAGVNLPAKRVIIRSPYIGNNFITNSSYKQMTGRAGRAGIDSSGESILVIKSSEKTKTLQVLQEPMLTCKSNLMYQGGKGVKTLILSLIGLEIVETKADIVKFISKTLYGTQLCDNQLIEDTVRNSVHELQQKSFIESREVHESKPKADVLVATKLGKATYKGSVDIDHAHQLYNDLAKSASAFSIVNFLHLLYIVTPYEYMQVISMDYGYYKNAYVLLNEQEKESARLIGITELFIEMLSYGQISSSVKWPIARRFYLTLILYDLWRQQSVWDVAEKFKLPRGTVQNLLNGSASFASCVSRFCQELEEFWAYQSLMPTFVKRLSHCVTMELMPLLDLPAVKKGRARLLYDAGFKTLADVAKASVSDITKNVQFIPKKVAHKIISSAKMLIIEKAESLKEEADAVISNLG